MHSHSPLNPVFPYTTAATTPAAGAAATYDVPDYLFLQLMCAAFSITTDANVADRYARLRILDGAMVLYQFTSITPTPANDNAVGTIMPHGVPFTTVRPNTDQYLIYPQDCILDDSKSMEITMEGIQVGDQIGDIRLYFLAQWNLET